MNNGALEVIYRTRDRIASYNLCSCQFGGGNDSSARSVRTCLHAARSSTECQPSQPDCPQSIYTSSIIISGDRPRRVGNRSCGRVIRSTVLLMGWYQRSWEMLVSCYIHRKHSPALGPFGNYKELRSSMIFSELWWNKAPPAAWMITSWLKTQNITCFYLHCLEPPAQRQKYWNVFIRRAEHVRYVTRETSEASFSNFDVSYARIYQAYTLIPGKEKVMEIWG